MKIWCPGCEWKPSPSTTWLCSSGGGCGHHWNTFATGGVCPSCAKVWTRTFCYGCRMMHPHVDWYHDDGEQLSADDMISLGIDQTILEPVAP